MIIINTTWAIIFGVMLIATDIAVEKGGVPTFKELITPSREYKQDVVVYDQIQKVGDYYIPTADTVYFVTEKHIKSERKNRNNPRNSDEGRYPRRDSTCVNKSIIWAGQR